MGQIIVTDAHLAGKLASKQGELYSSFEEVPEEIAKTQMRPHMFPPPPDTAASLGLDKCLRLLPHHHNTGGFFLALLEKVQHCYCFIIVSVLFH